MPLDGQDLTQFLDQARIRLTGASDAGLKAELFDVLKEFFKDSNCWVEDINFTPLNNVTTYNLVPADGGQIIRLVGVFDDKGIPVPAWMGITTPGADFGTITLPNAPNVKASIQWTARVIKNVMLPTSRHGTPDAPVWTLRVYEDVVLDGLCGRLMGQPGKSYTNPQMSQYHLKRFRTGITNARTAAIRMNTVGGQEWAYPRGWSTSSQRGGVSTAWPTRAF